MDEEIKLPPRSRRPARNASRRRARKPYDTEIDISPELVKPVSAPKEQLVDWKGWNDFCDERQKAEQEKVKEHYYGFTEPKFVGAFPTKPTTFLYDKYYNDYAEPAFIEAAQQEAVEELKMSTNYGADYIDDSNNWMHKAEASWASKVTKQYVTDGIMDGSIPELNAKAAPKEPKVKKPRYPAYKQNDRVETPKGPGNVFVVDKDGTVCVEIDNDPGIVHEFEKKELKKIK